MSVITSIEAEWTRLIAELESLFKKAVVTPPPVAAAPVVTKPST